MAGGGPRVDIKKDFLTCSICMEPFTRPKILLPCLHTFCQHCLASYLSSGAASKKRGGFPCPTCRQHVPITKPSRPPHTWPDQVRSWLIIFGHGLKGPDSLSDSVVRLGRTHTKRDFIGLLQ